jgi:hypothetical protein
MSYNPSIPNIGDFTALSQKQMIANFQAINNTFLIDHVALTAVENVGMHNSLTLRPQTIDPTTAVDQSAIYNKIVSSFPQLFFRPSSNQTPIQLSNSNLNTVQTGASGDTQSSFLAGAFTIYLGIVRSCPPLQLITVSPSSTLIYVGLTTYLNGGALPTTLNLAAAIDILGNQFKIKYDSLNLSFTTPPTIYYMAIGQ